MAHFSNTPHQHSIPYWQNNLKYPIFKKIKTEVKTFRDKVSRFAWERARRYFLIRNEWSKNTKYNFKRN